MPGELKPYDRSVKVPQLDVPRASLRLEDPWSLPAGVSDFQAGLVLSVDGASPLLETRLALFHDRTNLHVLFRGNDDHEVATMTERDAPLYEEDVVEVFLAPSGLQTYYEFEASPSGVVFDARIESPDGDRRTMRADVGWNCDLVVQTRRVQDSRGAQTLEVAMSVPIAAIDPAFDPEAGAEWRANFYRIDRHPERGTEFTAWSPTLVKPADFHVTARFGILRLLPWVGEGSPSGPLKLLLGITIECMLF